MSYGVGAALQSAIFQAIANDAAVVGFVGANVFDAPPSGTVPQLYVTLGPETVVDASDQTGQGARHAVVVSVLSDMAGFLRAKQVAAAVSDVLVDADLSLTRGHLVGLSFVSAKARRIPNSDVRRIDMTFRARVEDN